jgi:SAM-dependent methyltransferase
MKTADFVTGYLKQTSSLLKKHKKSRAMSLAVGGDFDGMGLLEFYLLRSCGLQKGDTVVDVGCGSGRLAVKLASFLDGHYLGIDVVPSLVRYAEEACGRKDWAFSVTSGLNIPARNDSADFVCFFSVLTHLHHEDSYHYLNEAKRVLKTGGRIVFSFLQFAVPAHWSVFENSLRDDRPDKVHSQFISVDAIEVWAQHLDLRIERVHDGDTPHIPLEADVVLDDGRRMTSEGYLGQSVCILTKRPQ